METIRTAEQLEAALVGAFEWGDWDLLVDQLRGARTFDDAGLLTRDRGIVVRLASGAEFQVTLVRSERPADPAFECPECGAEVELADAFVGHLITAHGWEHEDALEQLAEETPR